MQHSIFVTASEYIQHKPLRNGRMVYNAANNPIGQFIEYYADTEMIQIKRATGTIQLTSDLVYIQVIVEPIWI